MMENEQFEDNNNTSSQLINTSQDEHTSVSPLLKELLELISIQPLQQAIKPFLEHSSSIIRVLGDGKNTGSELINSSEEEQTQVSPLLKNQLEVIVIQTFEREIQPKLVTLLRRVVKEEIESARETIFPSMKRNFSNEIQPSESKKLQLCFLNKLYLPVLTGKQIASEECDSIKVALLDGSTGEIVNCGPESSAKVEIVVLKGDLHNGEGHDWTVEEFDQKIVREREGRKSLINGDACLKMKEGVGTVGVISFTHNSIWKKNEELRLGARIIHNSSGTRVREAISEPFILRDRRSSLHEKHNPPLLSDEVWRLNKIAKDGTFHERLSKENITNVKEFLALSVINPQRLHVILAAGTKMVKIMTDHAQTCILDKMVYLYRPSAQQNDGVVLNIVGELMGRLLECQYFPIDILTETQKTDARNLVVSASEHLEDFFIKKKHGENVISFDDLNSLIHACSETHPSNSPRLENPSANNSRTFHMINENNDMLPSTSSPVTFPSFHPLGGISNVDDGGMLTIDSMDFTVEQLLSEPGEGASSFSFDPFFMFQDFDEHKGLFCFNNDCNPQPENPSVELPPVEQSATGCSGLVCATAVAQAQTRWRKVFAIIQWFKFRSIVRSNHVRKKQRCC